MLRCKTCRKQCSENTVITHNGLYFCCEECFTSFLIKEKEQEDRNYCYATISRIFGVRPLTPKLFAEVKRTCENEKLTYKNLAAVLHYMYEVKQIPIYSPTLFYVPQYVEEAKEYYKTIQTRIDQAEELIKKDKERNSVVVKPNYKNNKRTLGIKINPEDV